MKALAAFLPVRQIVVAGADAAGFQRFEKDTSGRAHAGQPVETAHEEHGAAVAEVDQGAGGRGQGGPLVRAIAGDGQVAPPPEEGEDRHRVGHEPLEHFPRASADHPDIRPGLADETGDAFHLEAEFAQRFRGEDGSVPRLHQLVLEFDEVGEMPIRRFAEQDGHPQWAHLRAFARKDDEAPAPRALRDEQPGLFQLPQRGLDRLVVHAKFGGELVFARQGAAPASAQNFPAQMLGDLVGDGEKVDGIHQPEPGRILAQWQARDGLSKPGTR